MRGRAQVTSVVDLGVHLLVFVRLCFQEELKEVVELLERSRRSFVGAEHSFTSEYSRADHQDSKQLLEIQFALSVQDSL